MTEKALQLLKKYYGYTSFREGQAQLISSIVEGRDTVGIMPTGGGKSICFQIPALMLAGTTIVFSPLISLMKDQVDALNALDIPASFINSSLDYRELRQRMEDIKRGRYKLVYIAPERLESEYFSELLREIDIALLVVDEAHCISQWGHDFRPSYRSISRLLEELPRRPVTAAFTATATSEVVEDIAANLSLREPGIYVRGFNRENLSFSVLRGENKRDFIINYLEDNKKQSGIIYAATRKEVDDIYDFLKARKYRVGKYHAGMADEERIKSQEDFLYDDINIMIATNAFGMGIDKSNVRYVIHHNMPKNMESYYQEAGRAGRDGSDSECILLFSPQDIVIQKFLIEQGQQTPERKSNDYRKLQSMIDYCHTNRCLRKYILEYFGETDSPDWCGNCSSCSDDWETADITLEAQKIFSCIKRMNERFGINTVADVLRGSRNKRVLQLGFDKLSTYGIMEQYTAKEIADMINLLVAEGYLRITEGEYPVVRLLPRAAQVLRGEEQVLQKLKKKRQEPEKDTSLFELLRGLRKEIAEAEKVPPYIIFPDATLTEMSKQLPTDERAMLSISGIGEAKLRKYGLRFMEAIRQYAEEQGIATDRAAASEPQPVRKPEKQKPTPTHLISHELYRQGKTIKEIARERELTPQTVQDHLIKAGKEGLEIDWYDFIPREYEELILEKVRELGADKLRPIKDALPDVVDYMAIKAVICKLSSSADIN